MATRHPGELRVEVRGLHGHRDRSQDPGKVLPENERASTVRQKCDASQVPEMRGAPCVDLNLDEPD